MRLITAATALGLALLLAGSVQAKSYSVPASKPLASLTIADDWQTNNSDPDGVVTLSPDKSILIAAGAAPAGDEDNVVRGLVELIGQNGFKADDSSKKAVPSDDNIDGNHAKISTLTYLGKDEKGSASVTITSYIFDKRPDQVFVTGLLVGSTVSGPAGDAAHTIMQSLHFTP